MLAVAQTLLMVGRDRRARRGHTASQKFADGSAIRPYHLE